jgi:hypothetical protein
VRRSLALPFTRLPHVPLRPTSELEQAGSKRSTALGKPIDDPNRWSVENDPIQKTGFRQLGETVGEHPFTNSRNRSSENREARWTLEQQSDDDAGPALAQ